MPQAADRSLSAVYTASDVYHIAFLLRQLILPGDLIPVILEHAGIWQYVMGNFSYFKFRVIENGKPRVYLIARIPPGLPPNSLRRITFAYSSLEEGYSWDVRNYSSYAGAWKWLEGDVWQETKSDRVDAVFVRWRRKVTNQYSQIPITNEKYEWRWDRNEEDGQVCMAMKRLAPGQAQAIVACPRFPAWLNESNDVKIKFDFSTIRRM